MANQRLMLKNKNTGACISIAKWYPGTGWSTGHPKMNDFLDEGTESVDACLQDVEKGEHPFCLVTENQMEEGDYYFIYGKSEQT